MIGRAPATDHNQRPQHPQQRPFQIEGEIQKPDQHNVGMQVKRPAYNLFHAGADAIVRNKHSPVILISNEPFPIARQGSTAARANSVRKIRYRPKEPKDESRATP